MECYKVVEKDHRRGSNFTLFSSDIHFDIWKINNSRTWEEVKNFFPVYKKGSIVKAVEGSPGILCFTKKDYAMNFQNTYFALRSKSEIIRVRGIGESKNEYQFSLISSASDISVFQYYYDKSSFTMEPPTGSIAFESVEVLD